MIGAAGFVAPRHMKAIKECGHNLLAAMDPSDSVGIIDSYFPAASFFTSFERFDRYVDKLRRDGTPVDYVSICSPNHLHDAHCRWALRAGADVICEKPLVLNPWNLDALQNVEEESGKRIYNLLQLRLHPAIQDLKKRIDQSDESDYFDIDLTYITPRGAWYDASWKGEIAKSGGITTNIGFHLFDMLVWIFGSEMSLQVDRLERHIAAGKLCFKQAKVKWMLSTEAAHLPERIVKRGISTYRALTIEGEDIESENIEFSDGFTDLHTKSYKSILDNEGYGTDEVKETIRLVQNIRNSQ